MPIYLSEVFSLALWGESVTVLYYCWNKTNGQPVTDDAANHTVRLIRDGSVSTPTNSPAEVSSTDAPGWYRIVLTASEMQANVVGIEARSSTANVLCSKMTLVTEKGRLDEKVSDPKTLTAAERTSIATTVLTTPLSSVESNTNQKTLAWLLARFFNRVALVAGKLRTYRSDKSTTYFEQNVTTGSAAPLVEVDDAV